MELRRHPAEARMPRSADNDVNRPAPLAAGERFDLVELAIAAMVLSG